MAFITGVVGLPGAGKTLFCVRYAWKLRKQRPKRRIVANFPLYLPMGEPVPVVESIGDCFELEHCDLLLDEMHLWMGSRDWKDHGKDMAAWVSQLRKVDVNLIYSTQDMSSVDKMVRDRTFLSYWLSSYRKLGFFVWRGFFGCKDDPRKRYLSGWYFFNLKIASLYDTEYVVKL